MQIDQLFVARLLKLCIDGCSIPGIRVKHDKIWFTPKGTTKYRIIGKEWTIIITIVGKHTHPHLAYAWSNLSFEIDNEDALKKDAALMRMFGWDELSF